MEPSSRHAHTGPGEGDRRMPAVKNVGEPCAGEPHARFEVAAGGNRTSRAITRRGAPAPPPAPPPPAALPSPLRFPRPWPPGPAPLAARPAPKDPALRGAGRSTMDEPSGAVM